MGSDTPVCREMDATDSPRLPRFRISSILSTPIISSPGLLHVVIRDNDMVGPVAGMVGAAMLKPESFPCSDP